MNITVKLSSGKTIELTIEEAKELFGEKHYQLIPYHQPEYHKHPSDLLKPPYVVNC